MTEKVSTTKAPFILDRKDFVRMLEVLPADEYRDRLADQFRKTRVAYIAHMNRRTTLLEEIEAVGRAISEKPDDTKLGMRAAALTAELGVHPKLAAERARAYADALTRWADKTYRDFVDVNKQADADIRSFHVAWSAAIRRDNQFRAGSPEYLQNKKEIARLQREMAPHIARQKECIRGANAVETAVSFGIGARVVHGRPQSGDIDRFVQRAVKSAA